MQLPKINLENNEIVKYEESSIIIKENLKFKEYPFKYKSYDFFEGSLDNVKDFDKLIKNIEKIVRNSLEYRNYIKFLKTELKLNSCTLLKNFNTDIVNIELHHYPFTLYDITEIILNYLIKVNIEFSPISVAERITKLHYENKVGLVPLTKTVHELAHNGEVFISINNVFGNIEKFIYEYNLGVTSQHLEKLEKLIELSNDENVQRINENILKEKRIGYSLENLNILRIE
jgi:hypothetical protein